MAFVGQFVEISEDVMFTVENSLRGKQMAVFKIMSLKNSPKAIYKSECNVEVLTVAMKTLFFSVDR